jgi:hypothetical protein
VKAVTAGSSHTSIVQPSGWLAVAVKSVLLKMLPYFPNRSPAPSFNHSTLFGGKIPNKPFFEFPCQCAPLAIRTLYGHSPKYKIAATTASEIQPSSFANFCVDIFKF